MILVSLTCVLIDVDLWRNIRQRNDAFLDVTGGFIHLYERVRTHGTAGVVRHVYRVPTCSLQKNKFIKIQN